MVQEIHFVTGKGGVGKSIVALSMAYKKSLQGQKVLLVELGDRSFLGDLLDKNNVQYRPQLLAENLDLALWSGSECLKEYALHLLKVERLYKLFFENPISRSLINVAPALPEIAIMGKITSGPRRYGPPVPYDCLVVDAFATGHFLALLKAPKAMAESVKMGPMGEQNRNIDRVLRNSELCHYHIVTLPEELPAKEAEDLFKEISSFIEVKPHLIVNKVLETSLTPADLKKVSRQSDEVGRFADYVSGVLDRQNDCYERLAALNADMERLPLVVEKDPWKMIKVLAERLSLR